MSGEEAQGEAAPKKPNLAKRLWAKAGITPFIILLAMKGALPSTIALAAYEGKTWADIYTTLGYLVAIMAHMSMCIQPRAKFTQSMVISILFVCLGAAVGLLQIQCAVSARSTVGAVGTGTSGGREQLAYDASACATAAVFLFVVVFLANVVKASRPQMTLPVIQCTIFTIVASVYAPSIPDMEAGMAFVKQLLITFLTGFAIAIGVSLFILPVTSRMTVEKQMGGMLKLLKGCLASQAAFLTSIESTPDDKPSAKEEASTQKLRSAIISAGELFGKIRLELGFARKEIAYGKLNPDQYSRIFELIREILQPTLGFSTFLQIMRMSRERRAEFAEMPGTAETLEAMRKLEAEEWGEVMKLSKAPYLEFQQALLRGLDHIAIQLEFEKRPKNKSDVEEGAGGAPKPGDANFVGYLEAELVKYQDHRARVIQTWAEQKGVLLPARFCSRQAEKPPIQRQETTIARQTLNQHQLYLILYINFLNYSLGKAIIKLVRWADARHEDGTMKKKRFINPGLHRLKKLFQGAFTKGNTDETLAAEVNGGSNVFLGDGLKARKDPEHLPPATRYEKMTEHLRLLPKLLSSDAASFGFRAATATMSIGIVAYLRQTRIFFLEQRGVWAIIMVAISMDLHTGQGIFQFGTRIVGTVIATAAPIVIWYMCDHNHAAILVVFWIYMTLWVIFLLKMPQYAVVSVISSVTVVLIIGYELQVDVIGRQLATSNGQEWFPVEILAPFRLATVCIGLAVAFIWMYFPYPVTTHGALRQDLGATIYILANYYSCIHTTVDARLRLGPAILDLPKGSPVKKLDTARRKVFGKVLLMLVRLANHHKFSKLDIPIGGRFPLNTYTEMIESVRNIFTYLALITYSSKAFITLPEDGDQEAIEEERRWLDDFRRSVTNAQVTSHHITTNLCLLSSAIRSGQPLPPYLVSPRPFAVGDKITELDPSLFGPERFAHPCYTAFAVGEVASAFITAELARLTKLTKELVGEVDFSFHAVSTSDSGSAMSSTLWDAGSSKESKEKGE